VAADVSRQFYVKAKHTNGDFGSGGGGVLYYMHADIAMHDIEDER